MMGGAMMDGMGFGMFFMMIFWVLILVGIVFAVVLIVRKATGTSGGKVDETAMEVLKKRYASGEITREEFEAIKKEIA